MERIKRVWCFLTHWRFTTVLGPHSFDHFKCDVCERRWPARGSDAI